MSSSTEESMQVPFMVEKQGKIAEVNTALLELSGYSNADLVNQSFATVWGKLLRITIHPIFTEPQQEAFLFTKALEARYVFIQRLESSDSNEIKYYIKEIPNSRFEDTNQFLERLIADNITGIGIFTAPDFILIKANQTYLNNFPEPFNTKEMFYGKCLKDAIPDFKGSQAEKVWTDMVVNNQPIYFKEKKEFKLDKYSRYWGDKLVPISINSEVKYIVVMLDDVTECAVDREHIRKESEMLDQPNKKHEAILDSIADAFYIFDREGNYVLLNEAAYKMLNTDNYKKIGDDYESSKYFDLEGKELSLSEMPYTRVLNGEKIVEQIICIKGYEKTRYLSINGVPLFDEKDKFESGVICIRDITETRSQSQIIKQQKELLEAVIENMSDALFFYNKDGSASLLNEAARKIFYQPENYRRLGDSINTTKYFDVCGNEILPRDFPVAKALRGEKIINFLLTAQRPDKTLHYRSSSIPIYDEQGNIVHAVVCMHDITDLIKKEEEIKLQQDSVLQAEREKNEILEKAIEMKDEFLSLMSHEFKTPLTVINAAIQAINSLYGDQICENVKKHIKRIRMNSFRQLRLVNNLLDITRYNAGHIKTQKQNLDIVFLSRAITESVMLFAEQKEVNLLFSSDIECKVMAVDDEKYERILLNLLSNAIKFTPKGKLIHVHVSCKSSKAVISVKDEGVGIPKNKQEFIFERFGQVDSSLTRQAEGTGIGLSLVKTLVSTLGGTITLESEVGKGSTFTVMLPITKMRKNALPQEMLGQSNSRIMQAVEIEFSDIYVS